MQEVFLGIDIGTGSSKGALVDIKGNVLAKAVEKHNMSSPQSGWYEQDADKIWWADVVKIARNITSQMSNLSIPLGALKGLSVSSISPCVLPIDAQGNPLRSGIMYGIDTRAAKEISEIENAIGSENIFAKTGQHLSSQSCCPKIRWIEKNEPEVWKDTKKILTATGYVVFKLTGSYSVDMYDAIGYAPLFNIHEKRWDSTYKKNLFDLSLLPNINWTAEVAGRITKKAADETGLPAELPVMTGTADAAAEALGSGLSSVGDMMMMYGNSNFFILQTKELRAVAEFWASNFFIPGTTVITGGMSTVGSLFQWLNDTFPGRTFRDWERLALDSRPGSNGVLVLPYFAGERTPLFDPEAKGMFFGMQLTTSAGDIYQAIQEAVGFGIRHNLEVLSNNGEKANRIIAIGGVSSSDMTLQIITDASGCPHQRTDQQLGACYGDAYLAAYGSGWLSSLSGIDNWVSVEREFVPNKDHVDLYEEKYEKYRDLYESTKHIMHG